MSEKEKKLLRLLLWVIWAGAVTIVILLKGWIPAAYDLLRVAEEPRRAVVEALFGLAFFGVVFVAVGWFLNFFIVAISDLVVMKARHIVIVEANDNETLIVADHTGKVVGHDNYTVRCGPEDKLGRVELPFDPEEWFFPVVISEKDGFALKANIFPRLDREKPDWNFQQVWDYVVKGEYHSIEDYIEAVFLTACRSSSVLSAQAALEIDYMLPNHPNTINRLHELAEAIRANFLTLPFTNISRIRFAIWVEEPTFNVSIERAR